MHDVVEAEHGNDKENLEFQNHQNFEIVNSQFPQITPERSRGIAGLVGRVEPRAL